MESTNCCHGPARRTTARSHDDTFQQGPRATACNLDDTIQQERRATARSQDETTQQGRSATKRSQDDTIQQGHRATVRRALHKLAVWCPGQWQMTSQGPALVELFNKLGYDENVDDMIRAYKADPNANLAMMQNATGNTEQSIDINYVWNSHGKISLIMQGEESLKDADFITHDTKLRARVADIGQMHGQMMEQLSIQLEAAKMDGMDTDALEKEIKEYDVSEICQNGHWENGIALTPFPKHFWVTKWIKKYFPECYEMANKMVFYKPPGSKAPPFVQIRVHRTCFLFKGRDGPGSITVNPEFAKDGLNELRDDLPSKVYDNLQFTIDIIGGKTPEFPNGLNGKLTCLDDELFVIPMAPEMTKHFNPYADDEEHNSYKAFKMSHPNTL